MAASRSADRRVRAVESRLGAAADADRRALRAAKRPLNRAEARLANAEDDVTGFTRRLVVLTKREEHGTGTEAKEAEAEERETEEEAQEEAEECDPTTAAASTPARSTTTAKAAAATAPLYTGTVEVIGVDHYGLDRRRRRIGCDP